MGIFDDVKQLDWNETPSGDGLPRIWYFNGVDAKTVRTNGEFYTKFDAGDGWKSSNRFQDEEGFSTAALFWAPVVYREQWFTVDPETKRTIWLAHYQPGARKYSEQIGFARGIDGASVLVSKGMTSRAIYGKGGIIDTFTSTVGLFARKAGKLTLPSWALYIPMVPPTDKKGNPVYTKLDQGSIVTTPVCDARYTEKVTHETIDALYVGPELLALGAEMVIQYKQWAVERRGGHDAQPLPTHLRPDTDESDPREMWDKNAANRPGINAPQPYSDDEIKPF